MTQNAFRTYRNRNTGLLQRLTPRTASADPNLEEVSDDAKPLAYTPIPQEAIAALVVADADEEPEEGEE